MKRMLIKYARTGDAIFLSHRETIRILERALRRSNIPYALTGGYSPRPRVSFSPALPLGVSAEAEYMEVTVDGEADADEAREGLNQALPEGLIVREVKALSPTMPRLSRWVQYGLYRVSRGEKEIFLLLSLGGERQGRLRDAMAEISAHLGWELKEQDVTRLGLYASQFEVFEDIQGPIYCYDGQKRELYEMAGEVT